MAVSACRSVIVFFFFVLFFLGLFGEQQLSMSNRSSDSLSGLQLGDFLDVLKSNSSVRQTGCLTAFRACNSVIFLDVLKSNSSICRTGRLTAFRACNSVIFLDDLKSNSSVVESLADASSTKRTRQSNSLHFNDRRESKRELAEFEETIIRDLFNRAGLVFSRSR